MELARLNTLPITEARAALLACCGSRRWAEGMAAARPFADGSALYAAADRIWAAAARDDMLEAFAAHPRIGERAPQDEPRSSGLSGLPRAWSEAEQSGAAAAAASTRTALARLNEEYERRFGYIFIVCATGKSADEMMRILETRFAHDPDTELRIAAEAQRKITRLRLERLITSDEHP